MLVKKHIFKINTKTLGGLRDYIDGYEDNKLTVYNYMQTLETLITGEHRFTFHCIPEDTWGILKVTKQPSRLIHDTLDQFNYNDGILQYKEHYFAIDSLKRHIHLLTNLTKTNQVLLNELFTDVKDNVYTPGHPDNYHKLCSILGTTLLSYTIELPLHSEKLPLYSAGKRALLGFSLSDDETTLFLGDNWIGSIDKQPDKMPILTLRESFHKILKAFSLQQENAAAAELKKNINKTTVRYTGGNHAIFEGDSQLNYTAAKSIVSVGLFNNKRPYLTMTSDVSSLPGPCELPPEPSEDSSGSHLENPPCAPEPMEISNQP